MKPPLVTRQSKKRVCLPYLPNKFRANVCLTDFRMITGNPAVSVGTINYIKEVCANVNIMPCKIGSDDLLPSSSLALSSIGLSRLPPPMAQRQPLRINLSRCRQSQMVALARPLSIGKRLAQFCPSPWPRLGLGSFPYRRLY